MPHLLPPEDPNSPASTFAPSQPSAGVAAADVDTEGPKDDSLPGTADHELTGQGPAAQPAQAADAADFPVIEDGKAVAPKAEDKPAEAEPAQAEEPAKAEPAKAEPAKAEEPAQAEAKKETADKPAAARKDSGGSKS
jgi:hypothetical protein